MYQSIWAKGRTKGSQVTRSPTVHHTLIPHSLGSPPGAWHAPSLTLRPHTRAHAGAGATVGHPPASQVHSVLQVVSAVTDVQ